MVSFKKTTSEPDRETVPTVPELRRVRHSFVSSSSDLLLLRRDGIGTSCGITLTFHPSVSYISLALAPTGMVALDEAGRDDPRCWCSPCFITSSDSGLCSPRIPYRKITIKLTDSKTIAKSKSNDC